eukprot:jgi/Bigna1/70309/fgenesh1_pg.11_\
MCYPCFHFLFAVLLSGMDTGHCFGALIRKPRMERSQMQVDGFQDTSFLDPSKPKRDDEQKNPLSGHSAVSHQSFLAVHGEVSSNRTHMAATGRNSVGRQDSMNKKTVELLDSNAKERALTRFPRHDEYCSPGKRVFEAFVERTSSLVNTWKIDAALPGTTTKAAAHQEYIFYGTTNKEFLTNSIGDTGTSNIVYTPVVVFNIPAAILRGVPLTQLRTPNPTTVAKALRDYYDLEKISKTPAALIEEAATSNSSSSSSSSSATTTTTIKSSIEQQHSSSSSRVMEPNPYSGNGGFSLRNVKKSRALLQCCAEVDDGLHMEDQIFIKCFQSIGAKVAPWNIALDFSMESLYIDPPTRPFGMHQPWCYLPPSNLALLLSSSELAKTVEEHERRQLSSRSHHSNNVNVQGEDDLEISSAGAAEEVKDMNREQQSSVSASSSSSSSSSSSASASRPPSSTDRLFTNDNDVIGPDEVAAPSPTSYAHSHHSDDVASGGESSDKHVSHEAARQGMKTEEGGEKKDKKTTTVKEQEKRKAGLDDQKKWTSDLIEKVTENVLAKLRKIEGGMTIPAARGQQ